ncbi:hypothetical protein CRENBAI_005268 [Crenichthys baileyi]|uniref:Uncharacterized protein n=1 Tax=Crenichthys baileyi TaxID=28760 RepID=A0AAV9QUZ0_9TELE
MDIVFTHAKESFTSHRQPPGCAVAACCTVCGSNACRSLQHSQTASALVIEPETGQKRDARRMQFTLLKQLSVISHPQCMPFRMIPYFLQSNTPFFSAQTNQTLILLSGHNYQI